MAGIDKDNLPYVAFQGPELAILMQRPICSEHNDLTIQVIEEFGAAWGRVAFVSYLLGWRRAEMKSSLHDYGIDPMGKYARRCLFSLVNKIRGERKNNKISARLDLILDEVDAWDADQIEEYYRVMRKKQLERDSIW